jgi:hypothetical protein
MITNVNYPKRIDIMINQLGFGKKFHILSETIIDKQMQLDYQQHPRIILISLD